EEAMSERCSTRRPATNSIPARGWRRRSQRSTAAFTTRSGRSLRTSKLRTPPCMLALWTPVRRCLLLLTVGRSPRKGTLSRLRRREKRRGLLYPDCLDCPRIPLQTAVLHGRPPRRRRSLVLLVASACSTILLAFGPFLSL